MKKDDGRINTTWGLKKHSPAKAKLEKFIKELILSGYSTHNYFISD